MGTEAKRSFEIDFANYVEVADGQWAPRSIRIESKDYFTAEYKFQFVNNTHWILEEVVSWFDAANKSRGVIENLRVNQPSTLYTAAMKQIEASRKLFAKAGEREQPPLTATPIRFGKRTKVGPYSVLLTVAGPWSTSIKIETEAATAESVIPVLLLDKQQRPLFAKHVKLTADGNTQRGETGLGFSSKVGEVGSIIIPTSSMNTSDLQSLATATCQWDKSISINVADPDEQTTRAYEAMLTHRDDGTLNAKLTIASSKGPAKFMLDLSVALLNGDGQLVAAGTNHATMLVKGGIVEENFDIALGPAVELDDDSKMIVVVNVGDIVSAPMGSYWGTFMHDGPKIPLEVLLDADDDACRKYGLQKIGGEIRLDKEFFDDLRDRKRLEERGGNRVKLLAPHAKNIARVVGQTSDEIVLVEAVRLLGHSGEGKYADVVRSQLNHKNDRVVNAAAIAVAMLGDASGFERLRAIFNRRVPSWENERDARRSFDRLETDALIALASLSDKQSITLLGEILHRDLNSLAIATHEKGHKYLIGRQDRVKRIIQVLGYCGNDAAVATLLDTVGFFDEHADIAEVFDQVPLVEALLQYEVKARDLIADQLSKGNYAYIRAFKLHAHKNPYYVSAVHDLLLRPDTDAWTAYQGVRYLWNVGTPAAVDVLKDTYRKDIHKDDLRARFAICEALATFGDNRGVADAFEAFAELYSTTDPPSDQKELEAWEDRHEELEEGAEDILARVTKESIIDFIQDKLDAREASERRAVAEVLWQLPGTPTSLLPTLRRWQNEADHSLSTELTKLINRE